MLRGTSPQRDLRSLARGLYRRFYRGVYEGFYRGFYRRFYKGFYRRFHRGFYRRFYRGIIEGFIEGFGGVDLMGVPTDQNFACKSVFPEERRSKQKRIVLAIPFFQSSRNSFRPTLEKSQFFSSGFPLF